MFYSYQCSIAFICVKKDRIIDLSIGIHTSFCSTATATTHDIIVTVFQIDAREKLKHQQFATTKTPLSAMLTLVVRWFVFLFLVYFIFLYDYRRDPWSERRKNCRVEHEWRESDNENCLKLYRQPFWFATIECNEYAKSNGILSITVAS